MNYLRQLIQGIRDAWGRLTASARINIVVAGLSSLVLIGVVAWFGAQPQYLSLTTGLTPQDASRVVDVLNTNNIAWREENNYERILVPATDRGRAQLLLADADLPIGSAVPPGWELFDTNELMTNQWLQNMRFMRAVQGELQKQLNAFDFVEYSHVLIREAPDELFASEQKPSEAAVTLKVRRPLTDREKKALVSLISRAGGPNLNPNNITIATTEGEPIWLPPQDEVTSMASNQMEAITAWEAQREAKILKKLHDLGRRGTVTVSAQMNFDEKEVNAEQVAEGTELSTYTTENTTNTSEAPPVGPPGTAANLPEGTQRGPGSVVREETTEEITNYEPSVTKTRTRSTPGNVVKYNVALLVEGDYENVTAADGTVTREYRGLPDEQRQALESLVRSAVDSGESPPEVTVQDMQFQVEGLAETQATIAEAARSENWERILQGLRTGGQVLLIIVGFFLVRRMLRRAIQPPPEEEPEEMVEIPEATREDLRRQEVSQEITHLAGRDPDAVAALLRSWMTEDED